MEQPKKTKNTPAPALPRKEQNGKPRIGLFGGSFNPIHIGHTRLGQAIARQGLADEVWFLVSPQNPLKQNHSDLLDDEARIRLARLAVTRKPHLRVSGFEMTLPRPSYMVRTLEALRRDEPDKEFLLIIGADNWLCFPQWKESEEIRRHHRILIYPRPGYPIDEATLPPGVRMVCTPLFDISSTEIRRAIRSGHYHGRGLSPDVWKEIKLKGYYR